jgi:uncharacterized protein with NRDE domain
MCLIAWNWQPDSPTPLVLLSNRDEFHARPVRALHWWDATTHGHRIVAGKDLQAGGTWLGVSENGRLAALTNFRTAQAARTETPSRGELVTAFLQSALSSAEFLESLAGNADRYNPFNVLVYDGRQLMGLHSPVPQPLALQPGVGGVSNAGFNTPWPKLTRLTRKLELRIAQQQADSANLLALLHDTTLAADAALPQTGVPLALERMLSSVFVVSPDYGTRASSVVALHANRAEFHEQAFGPAGLADTHRPVTVQRWSFPSST